MDYEQRIAALEAELVKIKDLKTGPRGPAGDISAAVANAAREVRDAEGRLATKAAEASAQYQADVNALRKETADAIAQVQAYIDGRIRNAVDGHAVQVLIDYHLIDANTHVPTLHADVTNPTNKK
jgi:hypothetical protein